jgi:D-glycero-D-manno-heptose 1,7-bisphosphate phosphatase
MMQAPEAIPRRTPALFLDRDGIINVDRGYVCRPTDFVFVPGIFALARFAAQELGWPIVVVSNQSGIGRGYFDEATYRALTEWMCERFREEDAPLARVYHCPYHPTHGIGRYRADHDWRKPRPGMVLQAAADLNLDLAASALIGDKLDDMAAAAAAGVPLRIRVDASRVNPPGGGPPHLVVHDLAAALAVLRAHTAPHGNHGPSTGLAESGAGG